jgi:hypothetical protein
MSTGLGDEALWICPTISGNVSAVDIGDDTLSLTQQSGVTVVSDTGSGGSWAFDMPGATGSTNGVLTDAAMSGVKSFSGWVNMDSTAYGRIWSVSANTMTFAKGLVAGRFGLYSSGWSYGSTNVTGTWQHIVVNLDGATQKTYLDGVLDISNTKTATPPSSVQYFGIKDNGADAYNGKMDDLRLFDRTLTQAEITHLATARGVLGPPGGDNFNAFTNAKYVTRQFRNQRFG